MQSSQPILKPEEFMRDLETLTGLSLQLEGDRITSKTGALEDSQNEKLTALHKRTGLKLGITVAPKHNDVGTVVFAEIALSHNTQDTADKIAALALEEQRIVAGEDQHTNERVARLQQMQTELQAFTTLPFTYDEERRLLVSNFAPEINPGAMERIARLDDAGALDRSIGDGHVGYKYVGKGENTRLAISDIDVAKFHEVAAQTRQSFGIAVEKYAKREEGGGVGLGSPSTPPAAKVGGWTTLASPKAS